MTPKERFLTVYNNPPIPLRKTILENLESGFPNNEKIHFLSQTFTKEELISEIKNGTDIGNKYVDTEIKFRQSLINFLILKILLFLFIHIF